MLALSRKCLRRIKGNNPKMLGHSPYLKALETTGFLSEDASIVYR